MSELSFVQILDREDLMFVENEHGQYIHTDEIEKCESYAREFLGNLQKENQELKEDKSKLEKSIIKIIDEINNGEHIDKEWVESILREQVQHPLIDASVKMYESLKKENQELRDQHERDCDAIALILSIIVAEGLQVKYKAKLERIFERQAGRE